MAFCRLLNEMGFSSQLELMRGRRRESWRAASTRSLAVVLRAGAPWPGVMRISADFATAPAATHAGVDVAPALTELVVAEKMGMAEEVVVSDEAGAEEESGTSEENSELEKTGASEDFEATEEAEALEKTGALEEAGASEETGASEDDGSSEAAAAATLRLLGTRGTGVKSAVQARTSLIFSMVRLDGRCLWRWGWRKGKSNSIISLHWEMRAALR